MTALITIWLISICILAIYAYLFEEEVILSVAMLCCFLAPFTVFFLVFDYVRSKLATLLSVIDWDMVIWRKKK